MTKLRVVLADDHAIVVEGLRRILEPDFEVVGAVGDGRALLAAVQTLNPDVVVVDISMPLLNGIEAARLIRKDNRHVVIIFLTMHADAVYAKEALEAGGSAYVLKSSAGAELVTAIQQARGGRAYVTPSIARGMQDVRASKQPGEGRCLTTRQREVLRLVAEGRTAKETAQFLHVSPRTVEFHKYRLMEELSVRTTAELTQFAIRFGILAL